ncbi:MAG: ABC transporter permease [Bacteroidetes bacterium]|nr:ABC transporter permease [Bacteroidota bacterium]
MFDDQAFQSWPAILAGAALFGGLFALVALLAEVVYGEPFRVTPAVIGLSTAAFVGYIGVALYHRGG